ASSGGSATASSGGGTTASSGGSATASSGGGTTASSGGSATASAPGATASGNGTTASGNGTTVGATRGIVNAAWDGTGQQGGQPAPQPIGQDGAAPAPQPIGQDGAALAQQPIGQDGAQPAPNPTADPLLDGIQPWPLPGAASPSQDPAGGAPAAQPAQQPSGQGQPPAEQGQPPATAAPTGPAANPAPSEAPGWGVHLFGFGGLGGDVTVGRPVHVGPWIFGGAYGEMGFSNIGTPNATFDIGHGFLAGGGAVAGVDVAGVDVDVEGGILWEKGKTDWSWPLGSGGTTGQNTNQYSAWSPNSYGGLVIGGHEVGGLYGCDGQSCTLTLFYGRSWPDRGIPVGPVTLKSQLWGGAGASVTWPSTLRWPW